MSDIETLPAVTEAPAPAKPAKVKALPAPAKIDPIDKALDVLAQGRSFSKSNIMALIDAYAAASRGACAVREQAIAFSKTSFESSVETAKSVAGSKTLQEALGLQVSAAKGALETYKSELEKLSKTVSASAKAAAEPLNARTSAMMAKLAPAK